jgi:hypothetical protein
LGFHAKNLGFHAKAAVRLGMIFSERQHGPFSEKRCGCGKLEVPGHTVVAKFRPCVRSGLRSREAGSDVRYGQKQKSPTTTLDAAITSCNLKPISWYYTPTRNRRLDCSSVHFLHQRI